MIIRYALLSAWLLFVGDGAHAQVVSISASGVSRESFNGMGAGATLPLGWRVNTAAGAGTTALSYASSTTGSVSQAANSGTPVTGGSYNWGASAGTDRAVGFMASAGYVSPNAVLVNYRNTTGATVTSVTLSYKLERYRVNTGRFSSALYASSTGAPGSWTAQSAGNVSSAVFTSGASAFTFGTPTTVYKTVTITGLSIANNADLYFMWTFTSADNANSQGIGLDDVVLQAGTGAPVVSASMRDSLSNDVNSNTAVNPGDKITYKTSIRNTGNGNALSTAYNNALPANTTASGAVRTSALAVDDPSYAQTTQGGTLTIAAAAGVLANDYGQPAPTVASFGNSNNTSSTVANGTNTVTSDNGATVTMNANGSFTYNAAAISGFAGYDRFGYTATTGNPPDNDALVTVVVGTAPSAANDAYNVIGNVNIDPDASEGLLTNDAGSNRAVTSVTMNAVSYVPGTAITTPQGGLLNVATDGSFTYNPPTGYEGSESFSYTIDNPLMAPSTANVTLTISGMVWFVNNNAGTNGNGRLTSPFNNLASFAAINNGTGSNPAAGDDIFLYGGGGNYTGGLTLLANQKLIGSAATSTVASIAGLTPAAYSAALPPTGGAAPTIINAAGNSITLASNAASNNGLYGVAIGNSSGSAILGSTFGTLTVSNVFINTTGQALSLTTGALSGTFASVASSGGTNNILFSGCTGSVTISGGAWTGASGASFSVVGGTLSVITSNSITQANNVALVSVSGGHASGTLTFSGTLSATNGTGLQFDNADGTYAFSGNTTLNGGDAGIDVVNNSAGTFTFASGTVITNPSGSVVNINASPGGNFTYTGTFTKTGAATGISISSKTGGAAIFNGTGTKTLSTSTVNAINLTNNTGATVSFSGNGLVLTTTTGTTLNATGGGTVSIAGTGNVITTSTGRAINIDGGSAIGSAGITLQSVSASGGGTTAVYLNNAGSNGFTVTGTGTTAGTGGTISGINGTDNVLTTGIGIYLNSTGNVSLSNMNFTGAFSNFAIRGDVVNNFTLKESNFTGTYGTNNGGTTYEGTIRFGTQGSDGGINGLTGTALFQGNNIAGGYSDNLCIFNNNAGALSMTVNDGTNPAIFGANHLTAGNDAFLIETRGSGTNMATQGGGFNLTLVVNGVSFNGARGDLIQTLAASNTKHNVTITNSTFHNAHGNIVSGGGGITLSGGGNTSNYQSTYNITGNTFKGAVGSAIYVGYGGQSASISGVIQNNTIGTPNGVYNSGQSQVGASGGGLGMFLVTEKFSGSGTLNHAVRIQGNVIADVASGIGGIGFWSNNPGGGSERVEATILNNTVQDPGPDIYAGLYLMTGGSSLSDIGKLGANISGNTFVSGTASGSNGIAFDQPSPLAQHYIPGYVGSVNGEYSVTPGTASAGLTTFLTNAAHNNTLTNGPFPNYSGGGVDATTVTGATGSAFVLPIP